MPLKILVRAVFDVTGFLLGMRYVGWMRWIVCVVILLGVSCWVYGSIFGHSFVRYAT